MIVSSCGWVATMCGLLWLSRGATSHGWDALFGGGLLAAFLMFVWFMIAGAIVGVARWFAWVGGDGRACGEGWHLWREFLVHERPGVASTTNYYLSVDGVRISRCRDCGMVVPHDGAEILRAYESGDISFKALPFGAPKVHVKRS